MTGIDLTPDEERVLRASADAARTVRRRRLAVITGGVMLVALVAAALVPISRELVLIAFAVYVVSVVVERIAYANSVLVYKSVICKLLARSESVD
jgi:hypothetical protein